MAFSFLSARRASLTKKDARRLKLQAGTDFGFRFSLYHVSSEKQSDTSADILYLSYSKYNSFWQETL